MMDLEPAVDLLDLGMPTGLVDALAQTIMEIHVGRSTNLMKGSKGV